MRFEVYEIHPVQSSGYRLREDWRRNRALPALGMMSVLTRWTEELGGVVQRVAVRGEDHGILKGGDDQFSETIFFFPTK